MDFDPAFGADYRVIRSFAERWALGALRQAERFREALKTATSADRAYELGEAEGWIAADVAELVDAAWVEQHLLTVATHQFETWTQKMLDARGDDETRGNQLIRDLRNVLEHLDEATIEDEHAVPNPSVRGKQSLKLLPGGRLPLGMTLGEDEVMVCDLVRLEEIEAACKDLTAEVFEEVNAHAIDLMIENAIEEQRGL
ncbi:hypothetical protein [Saccharopolyspora sp. 6V]|uniref:hypothetical protein n=1 Tax=Saccharopolyspora sp. 6V TaxID=2877239 RepID=UPI001CD79165|nr:hypothetical protein [Saccharopolyspora sp. 6V]MCA1195120.1 hypothetical protein [Saccharopolyspora sp. 6V]